MVYHIPNCTVLFSKSSFFIQKTQLTIANSQPPDPRPVAPASPQFSLTPSNPPRTMNYTAPPSSNALDTEKLSPCNIPDTIPAKLWALAYRHLGSAASFGTRCIQRAILRGIGLIKRKTKTVFPFWKLPCTGIAAALPFIPFHPKFFF